MSRVTQRRFGEPDERVPDGLAIGTLAIAQPAKPGQVADRSRTDHHLYHHGTSPPSLPPAALSFGLGRAHAERGRWLHLQFGRKGDFRRKIVELAEEEAER
jgi:hypothetical protein